MVTRAKARARSRLVKSSSLISEISEKVRVFIDQGVFKFTPNELNYLFEEIKSVFTQIFKAVEANFKNTLVKNLQKPELFVELFKQPLKLHEHHRDHLKSRVVCLVKARMGNRVLEELHYHVKLLTNNLSKRIKKQSDHELRLLLVILAQFTMVSVKNELETVTRPLVSCDSTSIDSIFEAAFFDNVVMASQDSFVWAWSQDPLQLRMLDLLKIEALMKQHLADYLRRHYFGNAGSCPDSTDDSYESMSVDEIVSIIQNETEPKKKQTKDSHSENLDREVEEFKKKLLSHKTAKCKLKPNLRTSWLESLHDNLKQPVWAAS